MQSPLKSQLGNSVSQAPINARGSFKNISTLTHYSETTKLYSTPTPHHSQCWRFHGQTFTLDLMAVLCAPELAPWWWMVDGPTLVHDTY